MKKYRWPTVHEKVPHVTNHQGMQIKTTVRCHFLSTRIIVIKKIISADEDVEKSKPSYTAGWNAKCVAIGEKGLTVLQNVKHSYDMTQQFYSSL